MIYIIEDNKVDSLIEYNVLKKTLPTATISLFYQAQAALQALEQAITSPQTALPDLILLDIAMPGMDGFEFLERCTALQLHKLVVKPLIYILTTSLSTEYLQKAKSHPYVEDVLFKPFSQKAIAAIMDKHFPEVIYTKAVEIKIEKPKGLTIENWVSEYKRLEKRYQLMEDKQSAEARGLLDHMEAVWLIIHDLNSRNR